MYGRTNHCVYNINYHIVFCPKFRHKIIKGMVEDVVKQVIQEICNTYGYTLIQMEVMPDHLHIFLSVPPTIAPTEVVTRLKSITTNRVFAAFPNLKKRYFWGSGLWSRGYYIGTAGNVSAATIRKYIEAQKSPPEGGENQVSKCKNNRKKKASSENVDILVEKSPLHLSPKQIDLVRSLQREAARAWNAVCSVHRVIYGRYHIWMGESAMKSFVAGGYGIHSQSVQAIVETYFECCERTRELREDGQTDWRYPYRKKYFFSVTWKPLGITHEGGVLTLSNGRGRESLTLDLPARLSQSVIKLAQIVWHRNGYWLHVAIEKPALKKVQGGATAAIDPGEVHAVTITDGEQALVVSGRLLRSLQRLRNKTLRKFQRAISKAKKGSQRHRKLLDAKYRFLNNIELQMAHAMHTISAQVAAWCSEHNISRVYIGDPSGVREKDCGRKHNQRMSQWPFGELRRMLEYKLKRLGVKLVKIEERGTSGTCPKCAEYTKQARRIYRCGQCGFTGAHRDVIGASGILDKSVNGSFTKSRRLPERVEYSRPKVLAPAA
jgi:putative transposase